MEEGSTYVGVDVHEHKIPVSVRSPVGAVMSERFHMRPRRRIASL